MLTTIGLGAASRSAEIGRLGAVHRSRLELKVHEVLCDLVGCGSKAGL